MKVLFLDDDPNRRGLAIRYYAKDILSIAETAQDAIRMLNRYSPYDLVSLDHDLGGTQFAPSNEVSGFEVAKYITQMPKDKLPKQIVVHSYNFVGAKRMMDILRDLVSVEYVPFNLTVS